MSTERKVTIMDWFNLSFSFFVCVYFLVMLCSVT